MKAVLIIVAAIVLLIIGYVTYGAWLAKQWGIDPKKKTPAVRMEDGVDYVAAKPAVLMGHHFSSIAGAGPINGPIQAAVFGWVPVFLWCVLGGIFFGGLHDFGSLFASIRHDGKSIGEVIRDSMGPKAHKLFLIFALLVLILVVASFVNVVAGTFASDNAGLTTGTVTGNYTTAMVSMLFIVLAVLYGILTNRAGLKTLPATILGIALICGMLVLGLNVGLAAGENAEILKICVLGDKKVGKTNFIHRFVGKKFFKQYFESKFISILIKKVYIDNKPYKLKFFDTIGSEDFISQQTQLIRETDGFIFMYDDTNEKSFDFMKTSIEKVMKAKDAKVSEIPMIIVKNKLDISTKELELDLGYKFAKEIKVSFFATSALLEWDIFNSVQELVNKILDKKFYDEWVCC